MGQPCSTCGTGSSVDKESVSELHEVNPISVSRDSLGTAAADKGDESLQDPLNPPTQESEIRWIRRSAEKCPEEAPTDPTTNGEIQVDVPAQADSKTVPVSTGEGREAAETSQAQNGVVATSKEGQPAPEIDPMSPKTFELSLNLLSSTRSLASADPVPCDAPQVKAMGWRDISKPSAKLYYKTKTKPARDNVAFVIKSEDQVPALPLLTMQDGRIKDGVIPTLWAVKFWNLWFPFCESTEILKLFSPESFIVSVRFKILFLSVDFIAFVSVKDRLETDGCIEIVMRSPPSGSEGKEWNGITVPPRVGILPRVCVNYAYLQAKPTSMHTVDLDASIEIEDPGGVPQWVKIFFFQQLSIRVIPEVLKFQKKFPGSALDKHLNDKGDGCADAASIAFILALYKSMDEFLSRPQGFV